MSAGNGDKDGDSSRGKGKSDPQVSAPKKNLANGQTNGTNGTTTLGNGDVRDAASQGGSRRGSASLEEDEEAHPEPHTKYPRISRPVELLRPSYDVVVIGSGYGGAVAASRMSRGGKHVCLLERGKERWPGEFPTLTAGAVREMHVSGNTSKNGNTGYFVEGGDPTGLYHLVIGEGQNAFVANGLGGTSLLNANVFLEADERTRKMAVWPKELREEKAWDEHYKRAREVLEPEAYPDSYPPLKKLDTLKTQAELMGWKDNFYRVPQTTRFKDGPNSTGVLMKASSLSGQDATGINDGSKSTTLVNYLSDAWNWGAEMFCQCEVRYVTKAPDREGYIVHFAWHGRGRGNFTNKFYEDLMWVHAKEFVFFGAGSLGTTEILLRSKERGLSMSPDIGSGMSGNGDILAFGYNTSKEVNSIGRPEPPAERPVGPCITGIIDKRNDAEDVLDGFVIEEGAVPEALTPFYELMLKYLPGRIGPKGQSLKDKASHVLAQAGSRAFGPYFAKGSTQKTQCYLIMSHDSSQATLTLKDDRPVVRYSGVGKSERAKKLHGYLAEMTNKIGGTYVPSPFYAAFGEKEITVHCIGGARMSRDGLGASGGTNHKGQLFRGDGAEVYKGLVVCDGALVPAALGVNPFATITALAERSVSEVAKEANISIDYDTKNGRLNLFGYPAQHYPLDHQSKKIQASMDLAKHDQTAGLSFTEVMDGFIHVWGQNGDAVKDFTVATSIAKSRYESARFFLSVNSWNTMNLVSDPAHSANLTGTFTCPALGGTCLVQGGTFQLFNEDARKPNTRNFTYNFDFTNPKGETYKFEGHKVVDASVVVNPLRLWQATTTLYSTIKDVNGKDIGCGTLWIYLKDFLPEVTTMQPSGPDLLSKSWSMAKFLGYFTAKAASAFFLPFGLLKWPSLPYRGYENPTSPDKSYTFKASDGVEYQLHMWEASRNPETTGGDPQDILFVPGAAVDQQIFALPTIQQNAVNFFTRAGHRVFCVVHRVGKTIIAQKGYTTYGASKDVEGALRMVQVLRAQNYPDPTKFQDKSKEVDALVELGRQVEPTKLTFAQKPYVIAHCAGSVALSIGLLNGEIPAGLIGGVTASNVFMNPMFASVNRLKASLPIPLPQVYTAVAGNWFDTTSSNRDSYVQQALNQVLRLYPVGRKDEICNSVVCHRSSLVFGRLWSHRNLNEDTHSQLQNFLGGTSMNSLKHLMSMGLSGYVTDPETNDSLVTAENLKNLKGIPILFISGAENAVYKPENTDVSFTTLSRVHGGQWYERQVFENRGHLDCWMGSTAAEDVYPRVRLHVDRVRRVSGDLNL